MTANHFAGVGKPIHARTQDHIADAGKMIAAFIRSVFAVSRRHGIIAGGDRVLAAKATVYALRRQLATALIGQHGAGSIDGGPLGCMNARRLAGIIALVGPSAVWAARDRPVLRLAHVKPSLTGTHLERFYPA